LYNWLDREFIEYYGRITGVDEAGRGPLAGPVVAAAVFLSASQERELLVNIPFINDSKKLSEKKREMIWEYCKVHEISYAIGLSDEVMIDNHNILIGTNIAMNSALEKLNIPHDLALIDGKNLTINYPNKQIIKGDALSLRIALASNIAKVVRDQIMRGYSQKHPEFGFDKNKGYGTQAHLKALYLYGPTPFHRLTFKPLYELITEKRLMEWSESGEIALDRYQRVLQKMKQNHLTQKQLTGFL